MRYLLTVVALVITADPALADEQIEVSGLREPVEILVDRWGVPHIYAENEHDLFFAQGYYAARDRLFQFELWRRQATGTVAEILGRRELQRDIGTRLHLFRKDLGQELNHYHPRGELIINAYVDGINAYIAETERDPSLLPIEFQLLGIAPGRWTPAVVISRHQGLLSNVTTELRFGRAVATIGADRVGGEDVRQAARFFVAGELLDRRGLLHDLVAPGRIGQHDLGGDHDFESGRTAQFLV